MDVGINLCSRRKKAMIINHNIAALNTIRQLSVNATNTQKALEKLSSGLRINSAADDAAGLAISEKMRGQIRGLDMAQKNAQDGISLIQTAEGALNETHSILQRMRELAVQAANDTNTDEDRQQLQKEVNQLAEEITRISNDTEFNTQSLLDGTFTSKTFQIGANKDQNITLSIGQMDTQTLSVGGNYTISASGNTITVSGSYGGVSGTFAAKGSGIGGGGTAKVNGYYDTSGNLLLATDKLSSGDTGVIGINISTQTAANNAIEIIDTAINTVSTQRSALGAYQNRLEHTINNLGTSSQNLTAAESRIRDVDYALAA
jgi:flagellin